MAGEATITQADIKHAATPKESKIGHETAADAHKSQKLREVVARARMASPMESLQRELDANKAYDKGEMQDSVDINYGERDSSGKMVVTPGTETEARANRAKAAKTETEEIIGGLKLLYAGLSPEQQKFLVEVLNSSIYADWDLARKQQFISGAFKDQDFIVALKLAYGEAAGLKLEDIVTPAKRKLEDADEVLARRTRDREVAQARLNGAMAAETSFTTGKSSDRLKTLKNKGTDLRVLTDVRRRDEDLLRDARIQLRAKPGDAGILAQITTLEGSLKTSLPTLIALEADAQELKTLESSKEATPDRVQALEDRLREAEDALQTASRERNRADTDLSFARSERAGQETKNSALLQKMPAEALSRYMILMQSRAAQASATAADELIKEALTADGAKMGEAMRERYWKLKNPRARDIWRRAYDKGKSEDDRANLRKDMRTLADPKGGLEAVIREALVVKGVTEPALTRMLADKTLMDKWGPNYAETVITGYIRTGGKITPATYGYIQSQEWGKQWIEKGLEQNKDVKALEADLKAKGVMGPEGFRGFLKTRKGKAAQGLLAILVGVAAGAITGPLGFAAGVEVMAAGGAAAGGAAVGGSQLYSRGHV